MGLECCTESVKNKDVVVGIGKLPQGYLSGCDGDLKAE